jgi:FkbM family methyltransferase
MVIKKKPRFIMFPQRIGLQSVIHTIITYSMAGCINFAYEITHNDNFLSTFNSLRSRLHGYPLKNGLRVAKQSGLKFVFPYTEEQAYHNIMLRNIYYPYIPEWDDVVIDVGAHMGFFSIKHAATVQKIVAVEPHPVNFAFLSLNIAYNSLTNISTYQCALGDTNTKVSLETDRFYGDQVTRARRSTTVQLTTLDTLVNEIQLSPTMIKIHAEGYELPILQGAQSTLAQHAPHLLVASEHYPHQTRDIVNYLWSQGYTCWRYRVPNALSKSNETFLYCYDAC